MEIFIELIEAVAEAEFDSVFNESFAFMPFEVKFRDVFSADKGADEGSQAKSRVADDDCPCAEAADGQNDFQNAAGDCGEGVDGTDFMVFKAAIDELKGDGGDAHEGEFEHRDDEERDEFFEAVKAGDRPGQRCRNEECEDAEPGGKPEDTVRFIGREFVVLKKSLICSECVKGFKDDGKREGNCGGPHLIGIHKKHCNNHRDGAKPLGND